MSDGIMHLAIEIPKSTYEYYAKLADKGDEPLNNLEQIILNGEILHDKDEKHIFDSKSQYTTEGKAISNEIKDVILPILIKYYIEGYPESEISMMVHDIMNFELMHYRMQTKFRTGKNDLPVDMKVVDCNTAAHYICPKCGADFGNIISLRQSMKHLIEAEDPTFIMSGHKYFRCGQCLQMLRVPIDNKQED